MSDTVAWLKPTEQTASVVRLQNVSRVYSLPESLFETLSEALVSSSMCLLVVEDAGDNPEDEYECV